MTAVVVVATIVSAIVAVLGYLRVPPSTARTILGLALLVVLGCVVLTWFYPDPWRRSPSSSLTVDITSPDDSSEPIHREVAVAGEVHGLPESHALWAAHRRLSEDVFYPSDGPCAIDSGKFHCPTMTVGFETDSATFEMAVWVVNAEEQRQIIERLRHADARYIVNQPPGVETADSIVKRRTS